MPPWDMIRDPLEYGLLLPLAASGLVFWSILRIGSRRCLAFAGLIALLAGFFAGQQTLETGIAFRLDADRKLDASELMAAGSRAVLGNAANDPDAPKIPLLYWLPWAALLAGVSGVIRRPGVASWLIAIAVSLLAARLMVRADLRLEVPWLWPVFAAVMLAQWKVMESAGRNYSGGWIPLGIAFAFLSGAGVIVHAHSASLGFLATIFAGCWLGIAAASSLGHCDGGVTAPPAAVLLPGLMLIAQQNTYSDVPLASFLLVALSPLAFVPVLILRMLGRTSPRVVIFGCMFVLLANAVALGLAVLAESIAVD